MMNMMNMMKQAQNIQKKLVSAQEELTNLNIEGTSGNGSVKVVCDGKGQFKSIKLSAEAINSENPSSVSATSSTFSICILSFPSVLIVNIL